MHIGLIGGNGAAAAVVCYLRVWSALSAPALRGAGAGVP